jgi:hypothetical protein
MWLVIGSQINSNYDILWKHRRAFDEVIGKFIKWSMSFEEYISKKEEYPLTTEHHPPLSCDYVVQETASVV